MIFNIKRLFQNKILYKKTIFAINISDWKRVIFNNYYSNCNIIYVPLKKDIFQYSKYVKESNSAEILVWGYKECKNVKKFAKKFNLSITRVEDGFLRSIGLGIDHTLPFSLCFDKTGLYYNSQEPSDFEKLANEHSSTITQEQIRCAKIFRDEFIKNNISKYNLTNITNFKYPNKKQRRVLIIGQCENDLSIKYSSSKISTNLGLIEFVKGKEPNAELIYKQHPDEIYKKVQILNIKSLVNIVIDKNISMNDLFASIDKVYTISSLLGFEALCRNIEVETLGMPFYAGWGLTKDSIKSDRRTAKLCIDELFALAYIIYPTYLDNRYQKTDSIKFISKFLKNHTSRNKKLINNMKECADIRSEDDVKINDLNNNSNIPEYFEFSNSQELKIAIKDNKSIFLYMPWIFNHTDILISHIESTEYEILPLNIVNKLDKETRQKLSIFAKNNPLTFKKYIRFRLMNLLNKIQGFIFTFDWAPISRIITDVCHELNIYTILIPHESIFLNKELYYKHPTTNASQPICDELLLWGNTQTEIFTSRGYSKDRIKQVGSPKLDNCISYKNLLSREQFCKFYSLNIDKPIILFACQNLDIQIDTKLANESQNQIILDIIEYCKQFNCQAIFRLPPSAKDVIFNSTKRVLENEQNCYIDFAPIYLTTPLESIYHSQVVLAINSTMLFESILMNKCSISTRYIEGINSQWNNTLIPVAHNQKELFALLNANISSVFKPNVEQIFEIEKLSSELGIGSFDKLSSSRIIDRLKHISLKQDILPTINWKSIFFEKGRIDVIKIASSETTLKSTQRYIKQLLNANTILSNELNEDQYLSAVQIFVQWGIAPNKNKLELQKQARKFSKDILYIEDGFIRSCNIGVSGTPTLSIITDDLSAYYDATSPTKLENILNSNRIFTKGELEYATNIINKIKLSKVSKYNTAPLRRYSIGRKNHKKVLLIDQKFNDYSVIKGMANENTFEQMLTDAINNYPNYDIIIKQHPDALLGSKDSYFSNEKLQFANTMDNIFIVNIDMNPYCLLEQVDEVFVCTSGMGFEALMLNKKVTCFGIPWYSGYGLTIDKQQLERRHRQRSLEELFFVSYIYLSRYFNPETGSLCNIEDLIEYIVKNR